MLKWVTGSTGESVRQDCAIVLAGPLLRRFLLPDKLPHPFLKVFRNILHAVESPSMLKGVSKLFLFRLPLGFEITIRSRHTRVPKTQVFWHRTPSVPLFNSGNDSWTHPDVTGIPDSAGFPESRSSEGSLDRKTGTRFDAESILRACRLIGTN